MLATTAHTRLCTENRLTQAYVDAVVAYTRTGTEDLLCRAYEIGREALQSGVSIAALSGMQNEAAKAVAPMLADDRYRLRLEQFFLEAVTVYDMAQNGYRAAATRMRDEIAERKKVEEELRHATFELVRQRDELDDLVVERTAEIQNALEQLRDAYVMLRQANEEQAEFTYALSHDLKSPLNTIAMMLDILRTDTTDADDETREIFDAATATAQRMLRTIDDVLKYSRAIEEELQFRHVDLNGTLADILADLRSEILQSGAWMELDVLPVVSGDPTQLRMLFQNLISNAIKFQSPDRPPRIAIKADQGEEPNEIRISVSDNGVGIQPEHRERIFGLFQRLHTQDEYPGTGLGLTLCRRVVGNHCGRLTVDSVPGTGSTFTVTLEVVNRPD